MNLIIKVLGDTWPILLVIAAVVDAGIVGIILWNRRKRKSQSVAIKNATVATPQASAAKTMRAFVFDNGVVRELYVPVDLIESTSRPLFPREMANKKVILLESIPASESGSVSLVASTPEAEHKGNGKKDGLDFLAVLGQEAGPHNTGTESEVEPKTVAATPKPKRRRRKNGKRAKVKA